MKIELFHLRMKLKFKNCFWMSEGHNIPENAKLPTCVQLYSDDNTSFEAVGDIQWTRWKRIFVSVWCRIVATKMLSMKKVQELQIISKLVIFDSN